MGAFSSCQATSSGAAFILAVESTKPGSNGAGNQVRRVGEDWRSVGSCTSCWYAAKVAEVCWCNVEEDRTQRGQSLRLNNVSMREQVLAWDQGRTDDETRSSVELIVADRAAGPGQWLNEASQRARGSQTVRWRYECQAVTRLA
jgi:hypothetical protein